MILWLLISVAIIVILVIYEVTASVINVYHKDKEFRVHRHAWYDCDSGYQSKYVDTLQVKMPCFWGITSYWADLANFSTNNMLNPKCYFKDDYSQTPVEKREHYDRPSHAWLEYPQLKIVISDDLMEILKMFAESNDMQIGEPAETGIMQTRFVPGYESNPGFTTDM